MTYCVISDEVLRDLERRVNEMRGQGWEPLGGICAVPARRLADGATIHAFYQAMVRRRNE